MDVGWYNVSPCYSAFYYMIKLVSDFIVVVLVCVVVIVVVVVVVVVGGVFVLNRTYFL